MIEDRPQDIEAVLACKSTYLPGKGPTKMYAVKWLGYSTNFNSWEPPDNFSGHDLLLIEQFEAANKIITRFSVFMRSI